MDALEAERRGAREVAKVAREAKQAAEEEEWRRLNPELAAAEDQAREEGLAVGAPHPQGRCKVAFPSLPFRVLSIYLLFSGAKERERSFLPKRPSLRRDMARMTGLQGPEEGTLRHRNRSQRLSWPRERGSTQDFRWREA